MTGTSASGVIVGQVQQRELRQFIFGSSSASLCFHKLVELAKKFIGTELVGIIGFEVWKQRVVVIA